MRVKILAGIGVLVLVLFLLPLYGIQAQEPTPSDDEVNAIAKKLYCPVCENIPLDVCPTVACEQWRETIREKLALGWDEGQIVEYFIDQYGDRVTATPPARGFNWLIYILPPVVIIAGAVMLFILFRKWRDSTPSYEASQESGSSDSQDPYVTLLEEELQKRG